MLLVPLYIKSGSKGVSPLSLSLLASFCFRKQVRAKNVLQELTASTVVRQGDRVDTLETYYFIRWGFWSSTTSTSSALDFWYDFNALFLSVLIRLTIRSIREAVINF